MSLPKDPFMLMSYINTQLRDNYDSFDRLCDSLDVDKISILKSLEAIDFHYNPELNQFK
ncbi:DUF4250 domain-containing protein [Oribacterium sp. WCC10]|uniref:DUF4250 domain-containing protein n=1 Tax=Oribacterium sp. WCC10 TaxID=1855343 RepID=UPI0008EC7B85|nr:DUF4250 domain-containing protein [Oribacterium sp. WCC10]SFG14709.1 protein of unknown function [Oribacterium sp. WCC10]